MLRAEKWTFASHGPPSPYLICTKLFIYLLAEKAPQYQGLCGHWKILTQCLVNVAPCPHCGIAGFNWHCEGRT